MSAEIHSLATLRPMLPTDVPVLAAIFQASIEDLTADDYDDAQREAWSSVADDEAAFGAKLQQALTLVATLKGAPVGFISLAGTDQIAMLYVYPPATRQGVGSLLLDAVEKLSKARGATSLTTDASDTARPFFEARGFTAETRQTVPLGDLWFGNTRMKKALA